ncbi:SapB/AmfS family lanthipeptide [Actinokineospora iranica]|uniref:SapB/AmfS family lantipeptide n=1 Tax=Actinokineospora iranica TaxID=1271860 RepID=A0A1G6RZD0_9PSEU|nr:SapB/AmfS family lanthipeptide [Actinokineospora iranica]SDD10020.1 hypothetical protein SAMN05216174_107125 [Actinokineospora iranica]
MNSVLELQELAVDDHEGAPGAPDFSNGSLLNCDSTLSLLICE